MRPIATIRRALAGGIVFVAAAAHAQSPQTPHNRPHHPYHPHHQLLADLINAYRAAPASGEGRPAVPLAPLVLAPPLTRAQVASGVFLEQALERAGYPATRLRAPKPSTWKARAAMAAIQHTYCRTLLGMQFSAIGAAQTGDNWLIVLAQPAPPSPVSQLAGWQQAGKAILAAVNAARASARQCDGHQGFTDMGAAYAIDSTRATARAYWTQVFGTPR